MERINPFARALRAKYMAFVWLLCALIGAELVQAQDGFSRRFQNLRYTADSTCFWITTTRDTICFPAGGAPDSLLIYLNGLTKSSDTVRLGGPLTDSTAIDLNSQALTITGTGRYTEEITIPGTDWIHRKFVAGDIFGGGIKGAINNRLNPVTGYVTLEGAGDWSGFGISDHTLYYGIRHGFAPDDHPAGAIFIEIDTSGNESVKMTIAAMTNSLGSALIEIGTMTKASGTSAVVIHGNNGVGGERGLLIDYNRIGVGEFQPVDVHYYYFPMEPGKPGHYLVYDSASRSLEFQHLTYLPMDSTQRNALTPAMGMAIFCTDCPAGDASVGVAQVFNGTAWRRLW